MFQFVEKLFLSLLVMLSTMEDRRRRLEDAEDSLVPEKTKDNDLQWFYFIYVFTVDCINEV